MRLLTCHRRCAASDSSVQCHTSNQEFFKTKTSDLSTISSLFNVNILLTDQSQYLNLFSYNVSVHAFITHQRVLMNTSSWIMTPDRLLFHRHEVSQTFHIHIHVCVYAKRIFERGRWKLIIGRHLLLPTLMRPCWSTVLQGSFDFLRSLCSCFAILFIFCIFMIFGNCRVSLNNIASSTATIVMVLLFLLACDLYCMIRFYLPICFSSHVCM